GRELGGFKSEERDDRDRVAVVGRAGVLVLENAPNNSSVDRIFMSRARNTNALDERATRGHASVALASRVSFLATPSRPFVVMSVAPFQPRRISHAEHLQPVVCCSRRRRLDGARCRRR